MDDWTVSPHRLALVLAAAAACWHVAWSLLVLLGWAQGFINFVFWLHFITPPYQVGAFVFGHAAGLIIVAAALGYVLGGLIAVIWNRLAAPV
jgi:heme/copper-type cytochrome/quinol oxidase subunit 4